MGRLSDFAFGRKALRASPDVVQALSERQINFMPQIAAGPAPYGGSNRRIEAAVVEVQSAAYGWLYKTMPAVRSVVDYQARNVAQLALRLYERTSDTERHQSSDHAAAELMREPNETTTGKQFIFDFVASFLVYHNAYILKFRPKAGDRRHLILLPSHMVGVIGQNHFIPEGYRVYRNDGTWFDVEPQNVIHWRGYDPEDLRKGVSPLETLRKTLAEEAAAQTANVELMKSGLAQPGWISRPLEAPPWSEDARNRFEEGWPSRSSIFNKKTPVLEEGMEHHDFGISPKDAEMLAGRRFTREEVALLYGMENFPPKTEDERMAFYADVLPPLTGMLASYLNMSLLRDEFQEPKLYFEFDLDEKFMGNDRLTALTSASGAPPLTRNEARAMLNLPPKPGGNELITPLNVAIGGKPSPQVMPIQDPNKPAQDGSHREQSMNGRGKQLVARRAGQRERRDRYAGELTDELAGFFTDVERSTRSKTLDVGHWAKKLKARLHRWMRLTVEREGGIAAERLGMAGFSMTLVANYLDAAAEGKSREINLALRDAISEDEAPFERAREQMAPGIADTIATQMTNFSHVEAAKQAPDASVRLKRWLVHDTETSAHPEMDGELARLTEEFSNGKAYPPYEHPSCLCLVEVF